MYQSTHHDTTNYTIPAFSSNNGGTWSVTTIVELTGVLITAITFVFFLWKKFQSLIRRLRSLQQASSSPRPDTLSEMEMGHQAPVSPQPSTPSVLSQANTMAHLDNDLEEQTSNANYRARTTGSDDVHTMSNVLPPSEIHGGSFGGPMPMTEACQSKIGFQQGQPRLLERISFPLLEGQEHDSQVTEDKAVTVRRTITA